MSEMSDTTVEEYSPREAFDLQEYAEGVISHLEAHAPGGTFEIETAGMPSASPVAEPSVRSRIVKTLGGLRLRRDVVTGTHTRHAGSQEPARYRYDVPTLRIR
jgi:hypothetical protein